jgi:hypothetical protein
MFNPLDVAITAHDGRANLSFKATATHNFHGDFDMNINYTMKEVPLPAAAWLFGSALLSLVAVRKNRIKH